MMADKNDGILLEADYVDPTSNSKYADDINKLHQKILGLLSPNGETLVTEEELMDSLKKRMPANKRLNVTLFSQILQDVHRDMNNKIDLNEFTKEYIKSHEQLKMFLDASKKEIEKEKISKSEYENKLFEAKKEPMNENNISTNSKIVIELGKIELSPYFSENSDLFFIIGYENDSKKTSTRPLNDLNFIEKISFPVEKLDTALEISMFSVNNPDYPIGTLTIPLDIIDIKNEEISIDNVELLFNDVSIGILSPIVLLITSFNDYYQKELQNTETKIQELQNQIRQFADNLESISEPFKYIFDEMNTTSIFNKNSAFEDRSINLLEGVIKNTFKQREVKWLEILKYCLLFCILTSLFTTLDRIDFVSIFIEIIFLFLIVTQMTKYFNVYFIYFIAAIGFALFYDLIDYFTLRTWKYKKMGTIRFVVKLFGFLGFLGKICWLIFFWISKVRVFQNKY